MKQNTKFTRAFKIQNKITKRCQVRVHGYELCSQTPRYSCWFASAVSFSFSQGENCGRQQLE